LLCSELDVAAAAGEAVNAATGRTSPSRANRDLREVVTGFGSESDRRYRDRLTYGSRKQA
jgi:hypothetical protein